MKFLALRNRRSDVADGSSNRHRASTPSRKSGSKPILEGASRAAEGPFRVKSADSAMSGSGPLMPPKRRDDSQADTFNFLTSNAVKKGVQRRQRARRGGPVGESLPRRTPLYRRRRGQLRRRRNSVQPD
jgi:hypothetical protein